MKGLDLWCEFIKSLSKFIKETLVVYFLKVYFVLLFLLFFTSNFIFIYLYILQFLQKIFLMYQTFFNRNAIFHTFKYWYAHHQVYSFSNTAFNIYEIFSQLRYIYLFMTWSNVTAWVSMIPVCFSVLSCMMMLLTH